MEFVNEQDLEKALENEVKILGKVVKCSKVVLKQDLSQVDKA